MIAWKLISTQFCWPSSRRRATNLLTQTDQEYEGRHTDARFVRELAKHGNHKSAPLFLIHFGIIR